MNCSPYIFTTTISISNFDDIGKRFGLLIVWMWRGGGMVDNGVFWVLAWGLMFFDVASGES